MNVEVILGGESRESWSERWHLSEELTNDIAWAIRRFGNLAEGIVSAKVLGPEQAWQVWGRARPGHLRESNGGSAPGLGVDTVGLQGSQVQEECSAHLSYVCSCRLLVLRPYCLHLPRAWPNRLSCFHLAHIHRNVSLLHWHSHPTVHWMSTHIKSQSPGEF